MNVRNIAGLYDKLNDFIDENLEQILIDREAKAKQILAEIASARKAKEEEDEP